MFWLCSVLPPSIREFEVYGECRTESQMCIFIFILSCLPKPEKQVLTRNMLCDVWDWFFSVEKKNPPTEEKPHISRFPFCFYRNLASIWLHCCDFSFLQLFFYGFLLGAVQKPSQPSALFPLYNYPSQAVAPLTTRSSHLHLVRRPRREILRRWARR